MFVVQRLLDNHREKVVAWERGLTKYLTEGNQYGYRDKKDYRRNYPHPDDRYRDMLTMAGKVLIITVSTVLFLLFVKAIASEPDVEATVSGKNCKAFNKNDLVRIQYGAFKDLTGNIVGGCRREDPYQVKISEGMKAYFSGTAQEPTDVSGKIIGVNKEDNLVVIEQPKEEPKKE